LDGLPQADLEERYLKHGTVVVHGKDHGLFQATKVRGSAHTPARRGVTDHTVES